MNVCTKLASVLLGSSMLLAPAAIQANVKDKAKNAAQSAMEGFYGVFEKQTTDVSFEKNKAELSEAERMQIQALVRGKRDQSQIDKVHVFVWSDRDYDRKREFTDNEKNLVENRADAIKKYLEELGVESTEVINMADQPNWFEKTLGLQENTLKEGMAKPDKQFEDAEKQQTAQFGRTIAQKGGSSKAVLYVKYKDDPSSVI
ncbi:MAG: hypothetical protein ACOH5I_12380 [Oligoflexus sp.]